MTSPNRISVFMDSYRIPCFNQVCYGGVDTPSVRQKLQNSQTGNEIQNKEFESATSELASTPSTVMNEHRSSTTGLLGITATAPVTANTSDLTTASPGQTLPEELQSLLGENWQVIVFVGMGMLFVILVLIFTTLWMVCARNKARQKMRLMREMEADTEEKRGRTTSRTKTRTTVTKTGTSGERRRRRSSTSSSRRKRRKRPRRHKPPAPTVKPSTQLQKALNEFLEQQTETLGSIYEEDEKKDTKSVTGKKKSAQ